MRTSTLCGASLAALLLSSSLTAQSQNDVDPNAPTLPPFSGRAMGDAYNEIDAGLITGDIRCLGTEEITIGGASFFVVTAATTMAAGGGQLYTFDATGALMGTYPQASNSVAWHGRDMEAISDGQGGYTLYVGSDNAELTTYPIDSAGVIGAGTIGTVSGLSGTTRALCTSGVDAGTGNMRFYTKSFGGAFYTFEETATGVFSTVGVAGVGSTSAYGFGYDAGCGTIWSTDTGSNITETDLDGNATGNILNYAPMAGSPNFAAAQGGLDVFSGDPLNTGSSLSAAHLIQGTPNDHILFVEMTPCGPPPPTVAASGSCVTGSVTFDVSNMTANGPFALVGGVAGSNSNANAGPCGLVNFPIDVLGLPGAPHYVIGNSDANGAATVAVPTPAGACGVVSVVGLDIVSCVLTNTVTI